MGLFPGSNQSRCLLRVESALCLRTMHLSGVSFGDIIGSENETTVPLCTKMMGKGCMIREVQVGSLSFN